MGPDEHLLDGHLVRSLAHSAEEVLEHAGVALDGAERSGPAFLLDQEGVEGAFPADEVLFGEGEGGGVAVMAASGGRLSGDTMFARRPDKASLKATRKVPCRRSSIRNAWLPGRVGARTRNAVTGLGISTRGYMALKTATGDSRYSREWAAPPWMDVTNESDGLDP